MTGETVTPEQKHLLIEHFLANVRLDDDERSEFLALLETPPYQEAQPILKTICENAMSDGEEQGRRRAIALILQRRFGLLKDAVRDRLAVYPAEKLDDLLDAIFDAKSLKDLGLED
jgi:hypothetical protein